jgi:hypothetical protein
MAPMFHGKEINQRFLKGTNDETYRSVPIFSLQWGIVLPRFASAVRKLAGILRYI